METNTLVGIDRVLVSLYRSLGLRRYLNETFQTESPLFNMTTDNITTAYQRLQLYNDYVGSYRTFIALFNTISIRCYDFTNDAVP